MKPSILITVLIVFSELAFAQSMSFVPLSEKTYNPIDHKQVRIIADGTKLPKDAKSIGKLIYKTNDISHFLEILRFKASSYGADIAYFLEGKTPAEGSVVLARSAGVQELTKADSTRINNLQFQEGDKVVLEYNGRFQNVTIIEMQKRNVVQVMYDDRDKIDRYHIKFIRSRLLPLPKFTQN